MVRKARRDTQPRSAKKAVVAQIKTRDRALRKLIGRLAIPLTRQLSMPAKLIPFAVFHSNILLPVEIREKHLRLCK
jgi:hypothetical protein